MSDMRLKSRKKSGQLLLVRLLDLRSQAFNRISLPTLVELLSQVTSENNTILGMTI